MPLLHNTPFKPEPPPSDLKPDEEVFLCRPTQEVFRDYEKFFNRYYLCNSLVWTCEYSGRCGLTYAQAIASEQETKSLLDALPPHFQRAILALVHNSARTNMKMLEDEIIAFYRERFIVGEQLDLSRATTNGCRSCLQVRVSGVILPECDKEPVAAEPLSSLPAQSTPPIACAPSSAAGTLNHHHHEITPPLQEAMPTTASSLQNCLLGTSEQQKSSGCVNKKRPIARWSGIILSPEVNLDPSQYKYVVQDIMLPSNVLQVSAGELSRSKSVFTREKVRLFLKNAVYKPSDRHPIMVKDQYVQKFSLGPLSQDLTDMLSSPTLHSEKKRSLAQASLDNFFSPGSTSEPKRPKSLNTSVGSSSKNKGSSAKASKSGKLKKMPKGKGKGKGQKGKSHSLPSSSLDGTGASTPKAGASTPKMNGPKTPQTFSIGKVEALKALNRAKKMKQMDLKRSLHKSDSNRNLSEAEWAEMKQKGDALVVAQRQSKKEERLEKLRRSHQLKRQERMRQRELMKPREDLLCEGSAPLHTPAPIVTKLPNELFGQTVMVMEFLHTFGSLFNIKDFIAETITFDQMEYALVSCNLDSHLFDIIRFLLQTVFAYKEEEHEFHVGVVSSEKKSLLDTEGNKNESGEGKENKEGIKEEETMQESKEGIKEEEAMQTELDNNVSAEGGSDKPEIEKKVDDGHLSDEEEDTMLDSKRLDRRLDTIKAAAQTAAKWPLVTQSACLHELILDPYTCSEVLRLHLLSSGGYASTGEKSWFRHAHRGGYSDADDPAVELQLRRPELLEKLARVAVYDLRPADKLEVLSTLCSQLLSYSVARDHIEVARGRMKKAQRELRELCLAEERRKKEREQKGKKANPKNQKKRKSDSLKGKENTTADQGTATVGSDKQPKNQANDQDDTSEANMEAGGSSGAAKSSPPKLIVADDPMETEDERKARIERQVDELHAEVSAASAYLQTVPLGTDRYHRRYWVFPCLPGLYVEHTVDVSDDSKVLLDEYKYNQSVAVSQDKHVTCLDPISAMPPNHPGSHGHWSCYSTEEAVQSLLVVLNLRGIREHNLRTKLLAQKNNIVKLLPKCPFQSSRLEEGTSEHTPASSEAANGVPECSLKTANAFLELYLREQILDIEEKIYLGNLGHLRDIENRADWRGIIETTGAAAQSVATAKSSGQSEPAVASNGDQECCPDVNQPAKEVGGAIVPIPPVVDSLEQLSRSLLWVQAGIEKKFLMPPLGTAIDEKHKRGTKKAGAAKDSGVCLEQWKTSLALSTSYSQVFVHLATLERAVMWSRSLMNVRCRICRRKGGDEYMLLCDGCDHGYHMYCLRPPLVDVPEGDWFCYDCKPVTPSKTRKRTQRILIVENSSESEEEEEEEGSQYEEKRSGDEDGSDEEEGCVAVTRTRRSKGHDDLVEVRRSSRLHNSGEKKTDSMTKVRGPHRRVSFASEASPCSKASSDASPQLDGNQSRKRPRSEEGTQTSPFLSKAEGIVAAIINLRCSQPASKRRASSSSREQQTLELRLCEAIWEELKSHKDSWPFSGPVKKREFPDYADIIVTPMDLKTVKNKLNAREYGGLDFFLKDMELIFSNCMLYHKRHSDIGKAGISLRKFLDKRCSDLGLHDLQLSNIDVGSRVNLRSKTGN